MPERTMPEDHPAEDGDAQTTASLSDPVDVASLPASLVRRGGLNRDEAQAVVGQRHCIENVAGTGGMGRVFTAMDNVLHRRVAIKMLAMPLDGDRGSVDPSVRQRVLVEARAMAGLRHPNLCPIHEVSLDTTVPFIVMEWIDGIELRQAWRGMTLDHRLAMFVKIVEATAAAHGSGLVHSDLKHGNILVTRSGDPVIVDFGLAKSSHDDSTSRQSGGTPGYAPPEQMSDVGTVGPPADVFALGVILYDLLTDVLPFEATMVSETLRLVKEGRPRLPEEHAPNLPWPLQRICLKALEPAPERRYADAHAMWLDLQRYLRGETVSARPSRIADEFTAQVDEHLGQVEGWMRQESITPSEYNLLRRLLTGILMPDSHWIIDSRRLSLSQITLYLGGWCILMALGVGMFMAWDAFEAIPAARYGVAWTIALALLGIGAWIQSRDQRRVALGYQITACLAIPLAMWLLVRETQWLSAPMSYEVIVEMSDGGRRVNEVNIEWLEVFGLGYVVPDEGLRNRQTFLILLSLFVVSLLLRRKTESGAFTLFLTVAASLGTVAAWASFGWLRENPDGFALLGLWIALVGVGGMAVGLWLNRIEERLRLRLGAQTNRRRDSWAVLAGALLMMLIGLFLLAFNAGDHYTLGLLSDIEDPTTIACAFIVNGVLLLIVTAVLDRTSTLVRARMADAVRWISPSHFLAGLLVLEIDSEDGRWILWLGLLALASLLFCYLSIHKQWRLFLFSGLLYLAIAYARTFFRLEDEFADDEILLNRLRLVMMAGMAVVGLLVMGLAWILPSLQAKRKLARASD